MCCQPVNDTHLLFSFEARCLALAGKCDLRAHILGQLGKAGLEVWLRLLEQVQSRQETSLLAAMHVCVCARACVCVCVSGVQLNDTCSHTSKPLSVVSSEGTEVCFIGGTGWV